MPPLQSTSLSNPPSPPPSRPPSPSGETKLPSPHSTSAPTFSLPLPIPPPSSLPALIIFDWDDTLLSSSFLSSLNVRLDSDLHSLPSFAFLHPQLTDLDRSVAALLSLALQCSPHHVVIITNAESGWVQLSAAKFLPLTFPLLSRVRVLSARSTYEAVFPDCPHKWKYCAFQREVAISSRGGEGAVGGSPCERSVISLGDSHVEREAVRAVTRGLSGVRCKSVKFAERSTCEQLRRQVELVSSCFAYIHTHTGDLDLQLTVTVNTGGPAHSEKTDKTGARVGSGTEGGVKQGREMKGGAVSTEYEGCGDSEMGSERESEHGPAALPSAQMAA